ncbi:DnaB-like helicase N-terminal domain-containing protein [Halochromatium salexigens]|uniref:DNA helicase DnaB-like N-terminal domain-containing protein n=1 Tax=Halochromatium salexigens TaxID=49447 RepID=A0AAJ0UGX9_HALSE|nr:DnaB-like helicase N-terminal domain-containing protein [Halochromatium salexigens]MBK5931101.1 hypothetical protein [Halochromatium salexigens]
MEQHQDASQRAIISRAERALLSGLMIEPDAVPRVVDLVSPADFGDDDHGKAFAAILALSDDGIGIETRPPPRRVLICARLSPPLS